MLPTALPHRFHRREPTVLACCFAPAMIRSLPLVKLVTRAPRIGHGCRGAGTKDGMLRTRRWAWFATYIDPCSRVACPVTCCSLCLECDARFDCVCGYIKVRRERWLSVNPPPNIRLQILEVGGCPGWPGRTHTHIFLAPSLTSIFLIHVLSLASNTKHARVFLAVGEIHATNAPPSSRTKNATGLPRSSTRPAEQPFCPRPTL